MLPRLALPLPAAGRFLDPAGLFDAPKSALWMEVGFGGGEHLADQAARHPEIGFIGCEPFLNGVAQLLAHVEAGGLNNIRVHPDDARPVLDVLPDGALGRLYVLFPDPWPKTRHHRRRFIGPENLPAIVRVLAIGADLRMATDDPDYLAWMRDHLKACPHLTAQAEGSWPDWPGTRYDAKARAAGRMPVFLTYRRRGVASEKA
jgi:tRNA (guanine-N7-)-methyltransferase